MIGLHILRVNLSRSLKIFSYNISISPQWAENIVEMNLPYGLSISLQRAENIVEMTIPYDLSIALQRSKNIVELTGNFLEHARVSHRAP